jgi:hypothetical protein
MLKWIKKALLRRRIKKETVAHIKYIFGVDGFVYIDFGWSNSKDRLANEAFSELFFKVHNGYLLENSIDFIKEECLERGDEKEFATFVKNLIQLQEEGLGSTIEINPKKEDKVVVKPTDIGESVLRGNE